MAIEREALGQWPSQLTEALERALPPAIPTHFELADAGDADLNLIALLQIECVDDRRWQSDRQTIAPPRNLHQNLLAQDILRRLYIQPRSGGNTVLAATLQDRAGPPLQSGWSTRSLDALERRTEHFPIATVQMNVIARRIHRLDADGFTHDACDRFGFEPRYRLTYSAAVDGVLVGSFEIASPAAPDTFKPYLSWKARKR